jgi:hypothetical protein
MEIYKTGTRVRTVIGDIEAFITQVRITSGHIHYEISWFKDGESQNAFLEDFEFTTDCKTKEEIGFRKNN